MTASSMRYTRNRSISAAAAAAGAVIILTVSLIVAVAATTTTATTTTTTTTTVANSHSHSHNHVIHTNGASRTASSSLLLSLSPGNQWLETVGTKTLGRGRNKKGIILQTSYNGLSVEQRGDGVGKQLQSCSTCRRRGNKQSLLASRSIAAIQRGGGGQDATVSSASSSSSSSSDVTTVRGDDFAMRSALWQDAKHRTIVSTTLLALLTFLSYYFQEDGMILFVCLLQVIMFQESSLVVGGNLSKGSKLSGLVNKWWWFLTMILVVDGPRLFPWLTNKFDAIAYGMISVNAIGVILNLLWNKSRTPVFREYIRQTAVSLLCLTLVVIPSSYWIGTLEEFGQKWLIWPAGLSLWNDIVSFLIGMVVQSSSSSSSSSSIAPKRTLQGYIGGAMITMGSTWLLLGKTVGQTYLPKVSEWCPYSLMDGLILAAFVSLVAPFGHSISTLVKRAYGHKKFGSILGHNHGGFVDLLDCQLLLAPFIYFYLSLYKLSGGKD